MERIITGTVVHGRKIGREIGFPTANILISESLQIRNGVYAGRVVIDGERYGALVNVGYNPTVPTDGERLLEAHLLQYTGDLYGREISVELVAFLRPEQKFGSLEALQQRIEQDKQEIIKILQIC